MPLDGQLKKIYEEIDDLCLDKKYKKCDEVLSSIEIEEEKLEILICYLTATLIWKGFLKKRKNFFVQVKNRCDKFFEKERAEKLLQGLE